ncbi:[FeFe] hydrogenase, group A [Brucepastera parasyntrophica]|uniref:NADH-dependent [FeFe] hydrogenase, group A6 n=1 Tax=Brucepastera parasyntrophica TaxID=2880008 RepID=UPI00210BC2C7|nr:NADH-dependent [FeFe] hydrogenase, group A6 [Brucepastera parasyntrophica]ULQ58951.1 [FeFe] hydrogenase, group A [Brucepastera parasyntrophica]
MVNVKINGNPIQVPEDATILEAAKLANITIPTLCYNDDLPAWASCGICIVRMEGTPRMLRACTTKVTEGMSVITHDPEVVKARKTVLELILSNHPQKCLTCIRNNNCELQTLAAEFNMDKVNFDYYIIDRPIDNSNSAIVFERTKCISCGRCVEACQEVQNVNAIEYQGRGGKTVIAPAAMAQLTDSPCIRCGQCAAHCPVGAIYEMGEIPLVQEGLANPDLVSVVQIAPAVRVALGEEFGMKPGELTTGKIFAALRRIGFQHVFDTNWSADLTIMEEGTELIGRLLHGKGALPMFTSCCPGWVDYVEKVGHDLLPHLSTAKSPQQMMGAMIKTYWAEKAKVDPKKIFSVAVMPCTAKKYECRRNETMSSSGTQDVDAVISTREFAKLIKMSGIDFNSLPEEHADNPLGPYSGAGTIFGATGGVMEAALRTAYAVITGTELGSIDYLPARGLKNVKEAKIDINGTEVRIAVVHQLGNVDQVLAKVREAKIKGGEPAYHFIEVMACRGGCVAGGGQPYGTNDEVRKERAAGLYTDDQKSQVRASHQNPAIKQVYAEYLKEPNSEKAHHLLHTHYDEREPYKNFL